MKRSAGDIVRIVHNYSTRGACKEPPPPMPREHKKIKQEPPAPTAMEIDVDPILWISN